MADPAIPEGLAVETVYVIEISYTADAPMKRPAVRHEHLTRIGRLMAEGVLIAAGGFLDFSAALFIVRAGSESEAIEIVRDDVYLRSGVWQDDARARAFGMVKRLET